MMEVEANGKTFIFPDGTPTEQIGDALDEYFASQGAQPATAPEQSPNPDAYTAYGTVQPPQMAAQQPANDGFSEALADTGKGILGAAINTANIPAEVHDAIVSAGAWAGGKLGVGDGTYQPAPRITARTVEGLTGADQGSLTPKMTGSKILAEGLPYFIGGPVRVGATAAAKGASVAGKIANGTSRLANQNIVGALAGTSGTDTDAGDFAARFGTDMALGGAANALFKGAGKVIGQLRGTAGQTTDDAMRYGSNVDSGTAPELTGTHETVDKVRGIVKERRPDLASTTEGLAVNPDAEIVSSAERLGIADDLLASHISGNQQYRSVEQSLRHRTGSSLAAQEELAISSLAKKAGELIDEVAGAPDALAMGSKFEANINRNMLALERRSDALYRRVDAKISPRMTVNAGETEGFINNLADDLGGWENLTAVEKQVFKAVNPGSEGVLTYAHLNRQRRMIGAALQKNQGPYKDADRGVLKQLYGTLSDDIKKALPDAARRDFEVATRLVAMRKGLEEKSIELMGKTLNGDVVYKASNALRAMQKGDARGFRDTAANIPSRKLRQEIFGTALRDMLSSGKRGADFNPGGFADWWQNMRASGQLRLLSDVLPLKTMTGLADVYNVARGIQRAQNSAVKTGLQKDFYERFDRVTGVSSVIDKLSGTLGGFLGAKAGVVGRLAGGAIAEKIAESARRAGGAESSAAADALMASPAFREAAKKAKNGSLSEADRIIRRTAEWRRFFNQLPESQRRSIGRVGILGLWHSADEEKQPRQIDYNDLTQAEKDRLRQVGVEQFLAEYTGQ